MIDKLEMFVALAREKHFGRAAESRGVTQPTLSAAIKQLEDQLGVKLVWRGSRFGGLTPEGKRVLVWARRIAGDARTMREEMRALRQGVSGDLRLAVIPTALDMAARLVASFCKRHPNVNLALLSRTSTEIQEMLDNLEIDAGVSYLGGEPVSRLTTVPLYEERYALLCAEGGKFSNREEVDWAEIGELPYCLLSADTQNRRLINQHFGAAGVTLAPRIESNAVSVLVALAETSEWTTILPRRLAEFQKRGRPNLRVVPLRAPKVAHAVGLIAPYREPHTPVLTALLQEARGMAEI